MYQTISWKICSFRNITELFGQKIILPSFSMHHKIWINNVFVWNSLLCKVYIKNKINFRIFYICITICICTYIYIYIYIHKTFLCPEKIHTNLNRWINTSIELAMSDYLQKYDFFIMSIQIFFDSEIKNWKIEDEQCQFVLLLHVYTWNTKLRHVFIYIYIYIYIYK